MIAPLRFRVWVAGEMVREDVVAYGPSIRAEVESAQLRHVAITMKADREGKLWLIECYDADLPEDRAYTRFGTDAAGMVDPQPYAGVDDE